MTVAIILAGGLGTRLKSVVPELPKPMAPIRGRPFLEYQLDFWIDQGVSRFILSVGHKKEMIMDHFGSSYRSVTISYVVEGVPLGTGGGLILAATGLEKPFLVLNGDTFFDVSLQALIEFHGERQSDWTMALFHVFEAHRYMGVLVRPNGVIERLHSHFEGGGHLANGGVYLVNPIALANPNLIPGTCLSIENDIIPQFLSNGGKLYGLACPGRFIDIGIPADYFRAAQILQQ